MKTSVKIILGIIVIAALFFFFKSCAFRTDYILESSRLDKIITSHLEEQGIDSFSLIEESRTHKYAGQSEVEYVQKKYYLRDGENLLGIIDNLKNEVVEFGFSVFESKISYAQDKTTAGLLIGKRKLPLFYLEISASVKKGALGRGKVALVLDDWGYNLKNLKILNRIKRPLTVSVLPNLPYSRKISKLSLHGDYEVILHLPLESHEHKNMEKDTICCDMKDSEIIEVFNSAILSVPAAKGVSNHMGSRATEEKETMSVIFRQMKKRNFFFLDSLVTKKSICDGLAKEIGIKFASRDIFLDNINEKSYIKGQLEKLARLAQINGHAIGIGHDRRMTLEVLEEEMKNLERQGIEFVYLSQMVK